MKLLKKLTMKNLKLNKKRAIVTVIGIVLSVALITAVASMFFCAKASLIQFEVTQKGNFHYCFYDVPVEDVRNFELNRKMERLYLTKQVGYAKLDGIRNEYKPYLYVSAFTKASMDNLGIRLLDGRFRCASGSDMRRFCLLCTDSDQQSFSLSFIREEVNVRRLVDEAVQNVATLCDLKDVRIEVEGVPSELLVCDRKWQVEAVTNILHEGKKKSHQQLVPLMGCPDSLSLLFECRYHLEIRLEQAVVFHAVSFAIAFDDCRANSVQILSLVFAFF